MGRNLDRRPWILSSSQRYSQLSCPVLSSQLLSPCQRSIEASVSIPCIAFTSSADITLVRALQLTQSPAGREREAEREKDKDRACYDGTSARLTTMESERARVFIDCIYDLFFFIRCVCVVLHQDETNKQTQRSISIPTPT